MKLRPRTRFRYSLTDTALLRLDATVNLVVVTAVLRFDRPLDPVRLKAVVQRRLLEPHPRFRSLVRRPGPVGAARPEPTVVDLDHHLPVVRLPRDGAGDDRALAELVATLVQRPLDFRHPPWQMHIVNGYGSGAALVARIHHCLADGIALARVLLDLADESSTSAESSPGDSTEGAAARAVSTAPRLALLAARSVARILALPRDPRPGLGRRLSGDKSVAWTAPVPLETVKAAGRPQGATVNDVALAAVAGALRRQAIDRGVVPRNQRVYVPVDLRTRGRRVTRELGNVFGLVLVELPTSEPDPRRRVRLIRERMLALRGADEAVGTYAVLTALGGLPRWVPAVAARILTSRASAIVTNVPGPPGPVHLAGARIDSASFWVPQTGTLGLGVSVFSYAGRLSIGVVADTGTGASADDLAQWAELEMAALGAASDDGRAGSAPARARPTWRSDDKAGNPMTEHEPRDTASREEDVSSDAGAATSRFSGGDPGTQTAPSGGSGDANSTTGTSENDVFVGRTAGADTGYEEETGAEVRAEQP